MRGDTPQTRGGKTMAAMLQQVEGVLTRVLLLMAAHLVGIS